MKTFDNDIRMAAIGAIIRILSQPKYGDGLSSNTVR